MMINLTPYWKIQNIIIMGLVMLINACGNPIEESSKSNKHTAHGESAEVEIEKGGHGGRLLTQHDFALELSIFETGVPPEFRAWASFKGESLKPSVLRGDTVVYEPHSFIVNIYALHNDIKYNWQYDNFEGRKIAKPKILQQTISVFGKV